jgi:hypothetical protein
MIICLGWGSLIWNPDSLAISGGWQKDGPDVPVEFLRQSKDGRLTLVIEPNVPKSTVLWAKMQTNDLNEAKEILRLREGKTKREYIGAWTQNDESPLGIPGLGSWAAQIGVTAVIWTALPAKFDGTDYRKPTLNEAIAYLDQLEPNIKARAEEYVRKTPQQITTPYRSGFEKHFAWAPQKTI